MQVFCVSNNFYAGDSEDEVAQEEAYKLLSGIPELREYCQSIPAEAQARIVDNFLENQVPSLLGSVNQWCLLGIEKVAAEQGTIVCQVLRKIESSLRQVQPSHFLRETTSAEAYLLTWLVRNFYLESLWGRVYKKTSARSSTNWCYRQSVSSLSSFNLSLILFLTPSQ